MKVEVFSVVRNEERMIPFFLRHYLKFAAVTLIANNCTDKSIAIAESKGAKVVIANVPDEINDLWYLEVKNNCWKESLADWIMIVDADEFIYHPDIMNLLENTPATIFMPHFFNMYSEDFPTTKGQIYTQIRRGWDGGIWGNKPNVFKRPDIKEINYAAGCHSANPKGNVAWGEDPEIKTLHMRFLSREYVIERHKESSARLSEINRASGWGVQYDWSEEKINSVFDEGLKNSIKVV